jgi:trehalose 6-phosphate phosphatase
VEDVAHRVGIPGVVYIGNHGMETWVDGNVSVSEKVGPYRQALRLASPEIKEKMVRGMRFEDKGATLSVHYRETDKPEVVGAELTPAMQAIAGRHGLVLTHGRLVFEFRPPINVDKGTAFRELVRIHSLGAAFFIGDDVTDTGAFQAARELRISGTCQGYGLGVKSQGTPSVVLAEADFFIEEVAGVTLFLDWVLRTRMASST